MAKLETRKKIVENWDAAPREISALLSQVEWLWSVMHYPNSKEWESVDAESALLAIAKELGVQDG